MVFVVTVCVHGLGPVRKLLLVGVVVLDGFTAADWSIAKVALHQTPACSWWISAMAAFGAMIPATRRHTMEVAGSWAGFSGPTS